MGTNLLECFLYQSKLAPGVDATCVAQIVKKARAFNESAQITGILVFDGEFFCQYIEGPSNQVQDLISLLTPVILGISSSPLCCTSISNRTASSENGPWPITW